MSAEQLNKFFISWSPKFLFNLVKGFEGESLGPLAACDNLKSLPLNTLPKVDLPSTCTAERWNAGQGCQVGVKRTTGDLALVLRLEKCAGRELPFFELKCEGKDCDTFATPCTQDGDCSTGTGMSCFELASTRDQCAQETCVASEFGGSTRSSLKVVPLASCTPGSYTPTVAGGCQLNGETFGRGFSYVYDAMDQQRTQVPKSAADVKSCVSVTCDATGKWTEPKPAGADQCYNALVTRGDAEGNECSGAGKIGPNPLWPHTPDNTCNFREISDARNYKLKDPVKPFGAGATRFVSNAEDLLGELFTYDAVDYNSNPFGCKKSSEAIQSLLKLARSIGDRHAGRSPSSLASTGEFGICLPGTGYKLEERTRTEGWTQFTPTAPMLDPEQLIKTELGLTCALTCNKAGSSPSPSPSPSSPSPPPSSYAGTGSACTSEESSSFSTCSISFSDCSSNAGSDFTRLCSCYDGYLRCVDPSSSGRVCDDFIAAVSSVASGRSSICSSSGSGGSSGSSGSSGSPWSDGNCTASCGKETFKYDGAAYTAAQTFDGAAARKARSVKPITPGATVLGHFNCIGSAVILPNHPVLGLEVSASGLLELAAGFRQIHKEAYQCRSPVHGGGKLTDDQYDVRSFTLSNVLYFMTSPVSMQITDLGANFRDLRTRLLSSGAGRLKMPATCSFDSWILNGQCRFSYTGLGTADLLAAQTSINVLLSVCPGSFIPEVYGECEGVGCKFFNGPQPCSSDDQCDGLKCHQLKDLGKNTGSGGDGSSLSGSTLSPTTAARPYGTYRVRIEDPAQFGQGGTPPPAKAAIQFASSTDISQATLDLSVQLPGGYTNNNKVLIFSGPYTGKFASVEESGYSSNGGPSCDSDSIVSDVVYESNAIYYKSTCSCTLDIGGRRRVAPVGPKPLALAHHMKRDHGTAGSASSVPSSIGASVLGFQPGKQQCADRALDSVLPSLIALVNGVPYDASKKGLCFVDFESRDIMGRTLPEKWANDQAQVDGSSISLKYLVPWSAGRNLQPIDDGETIKTQFGSAPWLEKTGKFCFDCAEGANTDVGATKQDSASQLVLALGAAAVAVFAVAL